MRVPRLQHAHRYPVRLCHQAHRRRAGTHAARPLRVGVALVAVLMLILPLIARPALATVPGSAPAVLGWDPGTAANVPLATPLTIYFNRPMDTPSVQRAWRLRPAVPGHFTWQGSALSFRPAHGFRPATRYTLYVGAGARDARGVSMGAPFVLRFTTADALHVLTFTPAQGTRQVGQGGLISIQMNHPMVPLAGLEGGPGAPAGWRVTLTPATPGHGRWLGTSTWVFQADAGLRPSTRYTVTLHAGARDAAGDMLHRSASWSFSTVTPAVIARSPGNRAPFVNPFGAVTLTFNQPMSQQSVTAWLHVRSASGAPVAGTFRWSGNRVSFKPNHPLTAGSSYTVHVGATARSASGEGTLQHGMSWSFRASPYPTPTGLQSQFPGGPRNVSDRGVVYDGGGGGASLTLLFSAPMRTCSVQQHLRIIPHVNFELYMPPCRFAAPGFNVGGTFRPSTRYTLSLSAGVVDAFGRRTTHALTIHFRTTKLDPAVVLYGPGSSGGAIAFSTGGPARRRPARAPAQALNVPFVHYTLVRLQSIYDLLSANPQQPPAGKTVHDWTVRIPTHQNIVQSGSATLTRAGGAPLAPGFYWLEATAPADRYEQSAPLSGEAVVATNATITLRIGSNETLAWVTRAADGKPAAHVAVHLVDNQGIQSLAATTDAQGVAVFPSSRIPQNDGIRAAYVRTTSLLGFTYESWGPIPFEPAMSLPAQSGPAVGPCCAGYPGGFGTQGPTGGLYLYTDRPIYRPGQRVAFKAIARQDHDGLYTPAHGPLTFWASDPNERQIAHMRLALDGMGAAHGSFLLPARMPLGTVNLQIHDGEATYNTTVEVADYRKPEYLVGVHAPQSTYLRGGHIGARANVRYIFNQPVVGQPVHWTVYAQPNTVPPHGWDSYSFYSWEGCNTLTSPPQGPLGQQIASGVARTDASGRVTFGLSARIHTCGAGDVDTIEATANDASNEPVSGQARVQVQPAALAIGLRAHDFVLTAGRATALDLATVRTSGRSVAHATVALNIYSRTYTTRLVTGPYGLEWKQIPHDHLLEARTVVTDAHGRARIRFTPPRGGVFHVVATAPDGRGNIARTAIDLFAGGEGFVDWGPSNDTNLQLKPDRTSYRVGQTAHVLVSVPFPGPTTVLITVERSHIFSERVTTFRGNSPLVAVPIALADLPNVYVEISVYHGWRGSTPPDWRSGVADLHVDIAPKQLTVHLSQDRSRLLPEGTATYHVYVTDNTGHGVAAEVSLALVDTALLALQSEAGPNIVNAYYAERPLGVSTASDGDISIDHLTAPPNFLVPRNSVNADQAAPLANAPAPIQGKRMAFSAAGGGGGCGGPGCGPQPGTYTRTKFLDTAYWRADVTTDAAGNATVRVRLPDNLTTWRLQARALAGGTRVGQTHLDTLVTQPLLLQSSLPRFLTQGDALQVGAVVNNTLGYSARGIVSVVGSGIRLIGGPHGVNVPAHGARYVSWRATVPQSQVATLTFRLRSQTRGVPGDAVQTPVPVYPPLTDETVATGGRVFGGVRQMVILPARASTRLGGLTVQLSATLTAGMGRVLTAPDFSRLADYVHDGNLDFATWLRANVALIRVPRAATGLTPAQYAALRGNIHTAIGALQADQYPDGGWPWYNSPFAQSDPVVTTSVLEALVEAGHGGYAVPWGAVDRGESYLRQNLFSPEMDRGARLHALRVLAGNGQPVAPQAESIYANTITRAHLDVPEIADLAQTLARFQRNAQAASLVARLDGMAQVSATGAHWEGALPQFYSQAAIGATAEALATIVRLQPHDPFAPAAARWLMAARKGDEWDSSVDTASALDALSLYARAAHEGTADYSYRVLLNARPRLSGGYSARNLDRGTMLSVPAGELVPGRPEPLDIKRSAPDGGLGRGPLYYVARLRYYLPARDIAAVSQGFSISRQYRTYSTRPSGSHAITSVRAGSPVRVVLTLHTSQTLYYLKLDDPLPSGLEPIDQTLKTSQQGLNPGAPTPRGVFDLSWFTVNTSLYDDHVSMAIFYLPPGTYHYSYLAQATRPGAYGIAPTHAEETFFPEVFAHGAGTEFTVTR